MRRGEVWWVHFGRPIGHRPAVLLTRDTALAIRTSVTVAPITRTARKVPSYVAVGPADGLPHESTVSLDDILTISVQKLDRRITTLSPQRMAEVDRAIKFALALR